jgi:tripartite-type tricarboxylate transporter receptor subunit TctC
MPAISIKFPVIFLFALANGFVGAIAQQDYPNRPVKVILPYAAGGAADITARVISQKLSEALGQSFVVENRAGANGALGADLVAKAPPDGYTLLIAASGPIVVSPVLQRKMPYDPINDFAPVSQITSFQYAVVVRDASPIQSMQDLMARAKENPGKISYGSAGVGGGGHLAGVMLEKLGGVSLIHVTYKGGSAAWNDLLGGNLSFTFEALVTAAPMMKAGKLRGFAVTGAQRSMTLPQLPTLAEMGFKDYNIGQFQGMLAPAKTDPAIVEKLYRELQKIAKSPDVIKRLVTDGGNDLVMSSPSEFANLIKTELATYGKLIKDANITLE